MPNRVPAVRYTADTAAKRVHMLETRAKIYALKGMGMTIFP